MEASDKDGPTRGYGAVLWQPAGSGNAGWGARNALGAAWTDSGRTATVFDSERSCRGRLTCAEFAAEVAPRGS